MDDAPPVEETAAPVAVPRIVEAQDRFKWTPRRTALYLLSVGVVTWLTAMLVTSLLVQVLLRIS